MRDEFARNASARRATQKALKCSNPECEFHESDMILEGTNLFNIITDVLRPGEFAPVQVGARFRCAGQGCGWIFTQDSAGKCLTVSPDTSERPGGTFDSMRE